MSLSRRKKIAVLGATAGVALGVASLYVARALSEVDYATVHTQLSDLVSSETPRLGPPTEIMPSTTKSTACDKFVDARWKSVDADAARKATERLAASAEAAGWKIDASGVSKGSTNGGFYAIKKVRPVGTLTASVYWSVPEKAGIETNAYLWVFVSSSCFPGVYLPGY